MRGRELCAIVLLSQACASSNATGPKPAPGSVEAIYMEALEDLEDGLYPEAIKGFSDIKTKFPYSKYAALADLRTADTHFERGKYLEAIDAYRRFLKFYPSHPEGAYAMMQIGEAYFEQIPGDWWFMPPSAEKDQANTRLAISAYHDMLARFPEHELAAEAIKQRNLARKKLADHELYVATFYFTRDQYKAAAGRAEGLLKAYSGLGHDAEALWIAGKSRLELGDNEIAAKVLGRLASEFPANEHAPKAGKLLNKMKSKPASTQNPGT